MNSPGAVSVLTYGTFGVMSNEIYFI
eukprot:SAG22_NODE_5386_length_1023_cov_1.620130_2_plen_25_part_01